MTSLKSTPDFDLAKGFPVLRAILNRRDMRTFAGKPVPRAELEEILYAASWAPNHRMTEPWRFAVVGPDSRGALIDALCAGIEGLAAGRSESDRQAAAAKIAKTRNEFAAVPVFIAAAYLKDPDPAIDFENCLAAACAVQNMLLAAEERGLSAHWGTGAAVKTPQVQSFLGIGPELGFLGLFQFGYPAGEKVHTRRRPLDHFTRWL